MSGSRRVAASASEVNGSDYDSTEPLYENLKVRAVARAASETSSLPPPAVGKKPKPGPKPSAVMKVVAMINMQQGQQSQQFLPPNKSGNASTDPVSKPAVMSGHSSRSVKSPAVSTVSRPTGPGPSEPNVTAKPKGKSPVAPAKKLGNEPAELKPASDRNPENARKPVGADIAEYADAADVRANRLPPLPTVVRGSKQNVSVSSAHGINHGNIYEEAKPVLQPQSMHKEATNKSTKQTSTAKLSRSSDETCLYEEAVAVQPLQQSISTLSNRKLPPVNPPEQLYAEAYPATEPGDQEENPYAEAAAVTISQWSPSRDSVFTDQAEPLYAEAIDVDINRLTNRSSQQFSSVTNEVEGEPQKSPTDVDSDTEEDPLYVRRFFLSRNFNQNKSITIKKTDKGMLEKNARRLSMMVSKSQSNVQRPFSAHTINDLSKMTQWQQHKQHSVSDWPTGSSDESMLDDMIPSCNDNEMTQMRKFLLTNILATERAHLTTLETMCEIPELHQIYYTFIHGLEAKLSSWTPMQEVGAVFKEFAVEEYALADEYLTNYQKAIATVQRCSAGQPQFAELTKAIKFKGSGEKSLEDTLLLPILQFQRNTLLLQDLIKATPVTHADYDLLQKTLKLAQHSLSELAGSSPTENLQDNRYLAKRGVTVEQAGSARKLRYLFLFNDLLVCTKQKVARQNVTFEARWYIALTDLSVEDKFSVQEEKAAARLQQKKIDELKKQLVESQLELRVELRKAQSTSNNQKQSAGRLQPRVVDRLKKRIVELEAELLLSSPYLSFKVRNWKTTKEYVLLMESDYERNNWKDVIKGLQSKVMSPVKVSLQEVQLLLNAHKSPTVSDSLAENSDLDFEDRVSGNLNITIHRMQGLTETASTFCSIEVDSYGHFFEKAKTRVVESSEPQWEEDFDVDLEGSQTLRILCYKLGAETDHLVGRSAFELNHVWLMEDIKEETIALREGITVTMSLHFTSAEEMMKRSAREELFGGRLENITRIEGCPVPVIVTSCITEIEAKGLKTVGLYRVCGRADSVESLKKDFNKNSLAASKKLQEVDVSVLSSLLKLYLRELPDALFTEAHYPQFIKGIGLADPDAKEKFMVKLIESLPAANFSTAMYIMDHLVRVAQQEQHNKMSLENLAVVFGPTLLRPAAKVTHKTAMEQLVFQNNEAFMQTSILMYYLSLKADNFNFVHQS